MILTKEEKTELRKLVKIKTQYEGTYKISSNSEQKERIRRDLFQIQKKLERFFPEGIPNNLKELIEKEEIEEPITNTVVRTDEDNVTLIIKQLLETEPIIKLSRNCDNKNVNILFTVIKLWEREFKNAMSDSHIKLEFTYNTERDTLNRQLDIINRDIVRLIEIFESPTHQGSIVEIKNKQTRTFLQHGFRYFKDTKIFWKHIAKIIVEENIGCLNLKDKLIFNRSFESNTLLSNKSILEGIQMTVIFLQIAIQYMDLPVIDQ